jgi:hypothetical protein
MLESFGKTVPADCTGLTLVIQRLSLRSRPESVQFHPENPFSPRLISKQHRKGCSKWAFFMKFSHQISLYIFAPVLDIYIYIYIYIPHNLFLHITLLQGHLTS